MRCAIFFFVLQQSDIRSFRHYASPSFPRFTWFAMMTSKPYFEITTIDIFVLQNIAAAA